MKAPTETPQPGPLINQPSVVISDALAKFIGVDGTFPQEDALKYLWDYIKANQLEVWFCSTFFVCRVTIPTSCFCYKPTILEIHSLSIFLEIH